MKLIKINEKHFIIVDSSEINIGDWFDVQIISLSEIEEAVYGYSIEEIALEKYPIHVFRKGEVGTDLSYLNRKSFTDGFKTHRELVKDKLFTIEDMEKAKIIY